MIVGVPEKAKETKLFLEESEVTEEDSVVEAMREIQRWQQESEAGWWRRVDAEILMLTFLRSSAGNLSLERPST